MPVSEEQLIALMKSKGISDEQIAQGRAMKQARSITGSAQPKQGQQSMSDMLRGINPVMGDAVSKMAGAITQMGGVKTPDATTDPYQLAAYKEILKNNRPKQQYFTLDEQGNAVPVEGVPDGAKPVPVGYTAQNQRATSGRADVAEATVPLREEQTQSQRNINEIVQGLLPGTDENGNPIKLGGAMGDNVPPGTTIHAGPMTIPLNPALTEGEAGRVSALPTMNKMVDEIKAIVSSPKYMEGGNMSHLLRGIAADHTSMPFLTYGNKDASDLQSKMANLKTTFFAEGGKALTEQEINVLKPLIEISGKSPERIQQDLDTFVVKYNEFLKAKQGGLMGYNPNQQPNQGQPTGGGFDMSNMSDEELAKMAAGQ